LVGSSPVACIQLRAMDYRWLAVCLLFVYTLVSVLDSSLAPTGSGKTVLFELAIVALLSRPDLGQSRIVYIAPTKVPSILCLD